MSKARLITAVVVEGRTQGESRHDRIDRSSTVTRLHHIGIGRAHAQTHVLLLAHDLDVRVINAATGELLRELTIDPTRDYQPTGQRRTNHPSPSPTI